MRDGTTLLIGVLLLYLGAEWFVKGAAGLGRSFGVRPLVIGLTAVAYGTSMPELVVSTVAALNGMSEISMGNVIGSNIANLGLILAVTVLLRPLTVEGNLIRRELPFMLGTSLIVPVVLADNHVSRFEGLLLLAGAVVFTWLTARSVQLGRKAVANMESNAEAAGAPGGGGKLRLSLIALVGLALLVVGGQAFVFGASGVALAMGISGRVTGLTIAAVGTSAPELATSIIATLRGHPSIAVGNVVGSNIFNVLFVLGGVAAIHPFNASLAAFGLDLVVLVALSLLGLILLCRQRVIRRREGALLLVSYAAYLAMLVRS